MIYALITSWNGSPHTLVFRSIGVPAYLTGTWLISYNMYMNLCTHLLLIRLGTYTEVYLYIFHILLYSHHKWLCTILSPPSYCKVWRWYFFKYLCIFKHFSILYWIVVLPELFCKPIASKPTVLPVSFILGMASVASVFFRGKTTWGYTTILTRTY